MALIVSELKRVLGEANVVADNEDEVRLHSSAPYSYHDANRKLPLCVAFATSEADVCAVVRVASAHRVAIVGVGAGTNLEGQSVVGASDSQVSTFICLSLTRMRRIVALHADDLDVVVEPGVTFPMLNAALAKHALVFPLDAGPNATIGGMIACGASGIRAVRYGAIRNHVLSLRVVTADGAVVVTGKRAKKMVAGLDLTRLFVGSEGTLGIITLATLRVYPLLHHRVAALASFRSTADVVACVGRIVVAGVPLNMCELLDTLMVKCVNKKLPKLKLPESELLYIECGANDAAFLARTLEQVRELANASGATAFQSADNEQGCDDLFMARKAALIAAPSLASGNDVQVLTTDVCVPVSALVQYVREAGEMVARANLHCPLVGHVGDGNLHYFVCFDNTPELRERAVALSHDMVRLALRLDGTSTGEHGTGTGKSWCLEEELGSAAIAVHRSIKAALDPLNIMNPGKILPSRAPAAKL
jgi:D-lactate dehydrogenase (cytochrome)